MKVYTVKKDKKSYGTQKTEVLNNTVYGNFNDAVAAMKADCDVEIKTPFFQDALFTIDEQRGRAYMDNENTAIKYDVEEHNFDDGKRG